MRPAGGAVRLVAARAVLVGGQRGDALIVARFAQLRLRIVHDQEFPAAVVVGVVAGGALQFAGAVEMQRSGEGGGGLFCCNTLGSRLTFIFDIFIQFYFLSVIFITNIGRNEIIFTFGYGNGIKTIGICTRSFHKFFQINI